MTGCKVGDSEKSMNKSIGDENRRVIADAKSGIWLSSGDGKVSATIDGRWGFVFTDVKASS